MTHQQPESGRGPENNRFAPPGGHPGQGQPSYGSHQQPGHPGPEQPNFDHQGFSQQGHNQPGYSQGPEGAHYSGGTGGPGDPIYPQGPGGPSDGGNGQNRGLMWVLIAAAVVIVGAIVALVVVLLLGSGDDERADATESTESDESDNETATEPSPTAEVETPHDAVESYFNALAEGDAETARSFIYDASDATYLTDEMLAASLELAPITDVQVTEEELTDETAFSQEVQVSYTLGDSPVTKRLYTYENRDTDSWEVDAAAALREPDLGDLEATINGEPFSGSEATVFLGLMYELGLDDENFTIDGDGLVEVTDTYASASMLEVGLTEEATETWRDLIVSEVEECVASTEMEAGCGLDLPENVSGATVVEGSVSRSLPAETTQALQRLTPRPSYSTPTLVGAEYFSGQVDVTYEAEEGGVTSLYELYFGDPGTLGTPLVDMAADELEVIWE